MTDLYLPVGLRQARSSFKYIDSTGVTRGVYTGAPQTTNYGGDRIGATIDFTSMGGRSAAELSYRAQLQAFLMSLRGKTNRVYLIDSSYTRRGSFPATELFTNTDFNGTTGWNTTADHSLSASDGVLRSKITAKSSGTGYAAYQAPAVTQFTPVALRFVAQANGAFPTGLTSVFNGSFSTPGGSSGYVLGSGVMQFGAGAQNAGIFDGNNANVIAGQFVDISFVSCGRCIQADAGANALLRSDDFGNAAWTKSACTILSDVFDAPDATFTMDALQENGANSSHYVFQTITGVASGAADHMLACVVAPNFRNFCFMQIDEPTTPSSLTQYFNLTAGGSVGSSGATGAGWSNRRAFTVNLGSNRILCVLIGQKTTAATSLTGIIGAATADGTGSYLGNNGAGGSSIGMWRATMCPTSVPSRLIQTTSAAVTAQTQSALSIYVKGLPVSTTGLLLVGDWVEIDGQLKMVTASLDSDAAGLGYLKFSPPLRRAVSDNTPVIVHKPMGRFMLAGDSSGWSNEPGVFSQAALELEEAFG